MYSRLQWIFIFGSLFTLLLIFELIRRKKLEERYTLLWIIVGITFFTISVKTSLLTQLANLLGIMIPANALFLLGLVFIIVLMLSLTVIISSLSGKVTRLTQKVSILEFHIRDLNQNYENLPQKQQTGNEEKDEKKGA